MQLQWGIIGCGDVTEVKSGPAFRLVPDSTVAAVMRRNAALAADYARRHEVPAWYDDAAALLNDEQVNAVYVATPPSSHKAYTLEALRRGLPVYVEKPVAMDAGEVRELLAAVATTPGAKVSVAHYRRALPVFRKVKELLDIQAIGQVQLVQLELWKEQPAPVSEEEAARNWRLQPSVSGGGYFHDLAPHQLDLLLYFFGLPVRYEGLAVNQQGEGLVADAVTGQLLFANNILCQGSWRFNAGAGQRKDRCVIYGSAGTLEFSFFSPEVTIAVQTASGLQSFHYVQPRHIQQPFIGEVVAYFTGKGSNPCSLEDALISMEIMDRFTRR